MEAVGQKTGYAEANDTRFSYEIAGSGDPMVLVHAGVAGRAMWDEQFQVFAQHYRVVRYDLRGYGDTPAGTGSHSGADDLHALLGAIGVEQAILIGCSVGGTIALDFALEHPDMTGALVLVSATPSGYAFVGEPPQKLIEFMKAYQQQDAERTTELGTQIFLDGPHRTPDQVSPVVRARARSLIGEVVVGRSMAVTDEGSPAPPAADRLSEVRVPTLIIAGEQDDPSIIQAGDFLSSRIPGARKVVIPGAAHLANLEQPEEFNQVVQDFLKH